GAMTRISLAPCSPFSVTPELMKSTAELAREAGVQIHTHLAETLDEETFCLERFGVRPVAYADQLGWLTSNAWYAHAVHLNDQEIDAMGAAGVGISHCPSSNMRLGSGIARIKELLNAGVNVSLGVDGSASNDSGNMLMEMRNALFLSRLRKSDDWLTARDVLWMATRGGAAVLGRDDIGELSVGENRRTWPCFGWIAWSMLVVSPILWRRFYFPYAPLLWTGYLFRDKPTCARGNYPLIWNR
ncbi:MAG: amidohydrolase family protein, partial [FCB group bacterium]|nr:amidohydrolase family protein [FCB group bacterium]